VSAFAVCVLLFVYLYAELPISSVKLLVGTACCIRGNAAETGVARATLAADFKLLLKLKRIVDAGY